MVGMVVTTSPSLSLYKMVVLPAASRPHIRIRISFLLANRDSGQETRLRKGWRTMRQNCKGVIIAVLAVAVAVAARDPWAAVVILRPGAWGVAVARRRR